MVTTRKKSRLMADQLDDPEMTKLFRLPSGGNGGDDEEESELDILPPNDDELEGGRSDNPALPSG
jgi:hypothetical protein